MKIITLITGLRQKCRQSGRLGILVFSSTLITLPGTSSGAAGKPDIESDSGADSGISTPLTFNSAFIHGASVDVDRFSAGNPVPPGNTPVRVLVNGTIRGKYDVLFVAVPGSDIAQPCFTSAQLERLGIKVPETESRIADSQPGSQQCRVLNQWITGGKTSYNSADFDLDLSVPQLYLISYPAGYTDPASWDSGINTVFLDYSTNVYTQQFSKSYSNGLGHAITGNLGLLAGANIYGWRFRNRSTSYLSSRSESGTKNLYTYVQRDIPQIKSQLTLGETSTSGDLFDSLSMRGVQLASDDRMLPESLRQYSPVLQGVAETNARVQITQRGQLIYETTVPPGPFELNSIGALGYGGDLQMTIIESNGQRRTQVIPYSAPPMLLHAGISRYALAVGEMRETGMKKNPMMGNGFYQYGLNNFYTLYGGSQFSENYMSAAFGQSFNTAIGGISMDVSRARSNLKNNKSSTGNSFNIGYSKYVEPSGTNISMTAYRYSSKGYYSLRDAAAERYGMSRDYYMVDYRTRQRLSVNVSQAMPANSRLVLAGNFYRYWNNRNASSQYSLFYSKSESLFSWTAGINRTFNANGRNINSYSLSLSIPLGKHYNITDKPLFSSMNTTMSRDSEGNSMLITNATGSRSTGAPLSYGIGSSASRNQGGGTNYAFNSNVNYNSEMGQFGSTLSIGNQSRQFSATASGSLVGHRGGLTIGPSLGDAPFAVVNAPGAEGARMMNGYGSRIDRYGYAIVPSLTPYRENSVSIDTKGLPATVDVLESEQVVIPRMGAAVAVNVKTQSGKPVIFIIRDSRGVYLPIGSEVTTASGNSSGIVGQGGMAFLRGWSIGTQDMKVTTDRGASYCTIAADKALADRIQSSGNDVFRTEVVCK